MERRLHLLPTSLVRTLMIESDTQGKMSDCRREVIDLLVKRATKFEVCDWIGEVYWIHLAWTIECPSSKLKLPFAPVELPLTCFSIWRWFSTGSRSSRNTPKRKHRYRISSRLLPCQFKVEIATIQNATKSRGLQPLWNESNLLQFIQSEITLWFCGNAPEWNIRSNSLKENSPIGYGSFWTALTSFKGGLSCSRVFAWIALLFLFSHSSWLLEFVAEGY